MNHPKITQHSIQRRILVPFAVTFVIILTFSILSGLSLKQQIVESNIHDQLESLKNSFEHLLEKDAELLLTNIDNVARDKKVINAWHKNDRNALYQSTVSTFEKLNSKFMITHFYFMTVDRVNFLRVHNPERYGDVIDRYTMSRAAKTHDSVYGIELGKFGTFTLRVVYPWVINGELLGYIEMGEEIEHLTEQMGSMLQSSLAITIHKNRLEKKDWQEGLMMLGKAGDWSAYSDFVMIDSFNIHKDLNIPKLLLNKELQAVIEDHHLHEQHHEQDHDALLSYIKHENYNYISGQIELNDAGGQKVGHIILIDDFEKAQQAIQDSLTVLMIVSFVMGLGAFTFFAFYTGRLGREVEYTQRELEDKNMQLGIAVQQANAATEVKSEFLANMSHEIRTPMNGVLGMLGLLKTTKLENQQREFVDVAYHSGESLMVILNDILDYSKIEAGKLAIEKTDFNLRETIEEVLSLFAEQAHNKSLEIVCNIENDLPQFVTGDPTRLRQILSNLTNNAIKFTNKGEIVVHAAIREECDDSLYLIIKVHDTGVGVPENKQRSIFEVFSQADGSTTRIHGGTGLGLTISQMLCNLMGGDIGVDSIPGQGSTFWFSCPVGKSDRQTEDSTADIAQLQGLRVLIVDDNETNRIIIERQVSAWGCHYSSVESAESAFQQLAHAADNNSAYDLLITDMMMPAMNGQELAQQVRNSENSKNLPIILLTSMSFDRRSEVLESGLFQEILTKPVRQSQLLNALLNRQLTKVRSNQIQSLAAIPAPPKTNGIKVLVAEDNEVNQKVALGYFKKLGYAVDLACDGRQAVDKLKEGGDYTFIFMDCQMPEMDGYTATQVIREIENIPQPIIIAMTANAMKGDEERCLSVGMDDYLAKPLKVSELKNKLQKWLPESGV